MAAKIWILTINHDNYRLLCPFPSAKQANSPIFAHVIFQSENQNINNMEIIDSKKTYKAPKAQVIEVKVQSMLCTSPGYPTEFEEENE